jgi:L-iditol 2-dehydrogenase
MQAAVLEKVGELRVKEVAIPKCPPDGILIKVEACAICGTDVKVYRFGHRLIKPPRITGHELAGIIVEVGTKIKGYEKGDRITVAPAIPCGNCYWCRKGIQNRCKNLIAIGYHLDGGFAEYMVIPSSVIRNDCVNTIPENLSFEEAALAEPLACAVNCQDRSKVELGSMVVIIGAGPVGCFHVELAKARGAFKVIMVELSPHRLELSRISGADIYIDASKNNPVEQVLKETGGEGAEVVITACSSGKAQEQALEMVCERGNINFFGSLPKGKSIIRLDSNIVHYKECYISGTEGSTPLHNKIALGLISSGRINIKKYITHRLPLSGLLQGLDIVEKGKGLKVIINPQD